MEPPIERSVEQSLDVAAVQSDEVDSLRYEGSGKMIHGSRKVQPVRSSPTNEEIESSYDLIKDDLETITEIVTFIRSQEDYATEEVIEKLEKLAFFYKPTEDERKATQLANFLAEFYPELFMEIQMQLHKNDKMPECNKGTEHGRALKTAYSATSVLWNTCDASVKMCRKVGEAGAVHFIIEELEKLRDYAVGSTRDEGIDKYIGSLLATTYNVIRVRPENRECFRDAGAVELLQNYLKVENITYRSCALLILSFIVSEDENDKINTGTENIKFLVERLQYAVESGKHRSEDAFHVTELVEGITKLAVNEANKVKFVDQGVLPYLVKLLRPTNTLHEQHLASTALWTLAFNAHNKDKLIKEGCVKALEEVRKSAVELRKACDGALWELADKPEKPPLQSSARDASCKGHVMISYNWDVQERMVKLKEKLTAAGYHVWMDVDNMSGSTLEAMAEAVQGADVVLICMSEKYKNSNNCRSEAEYAYKLNKDYIPIRVQPKYYPDGWLGILVGTRLYFDFSSDEKLESRFSQLAREIGDRGKGETGCPETKETVKDTTPVPGKPLPRKPVKSWDNEDVVTWLERNELSHMASGFTKYSGAKLLTLRKLSMRAPDYFYNSLHKELGFTNMYDVVSFTDALDQLG